MPRKLQRPSGCHPGVSAALGNSGMENVHGLVPCLSYPGLLGMCSTFEVLGRVRRTGQIALPACLIGWRLL